MKRLVLSITALLATPFIYLFLQSVVAPLAARQTGWPPYDTLNRQFTDYIVKRAAAKNLNMNNLRTEMEAAQKLRQQQKQKRADDEMKLSGRRDAELVEKYRKEDEAFAKTLRHLPQSQQITALHERYENRLRAAKAFDNSIKDLSPEQRRLAIIQHTEAELRN